MEDKFSTTESDFRLHLVGHVDFLLKMPHGIKVCCFQSLAVVHLVVHPTLFRTTKFVIENAALQKSSLCFPVHIGVSI